MFSTEKLGYTPEKPPPPSPPAESKEEAPEPEQQLIYPKAPAVLIETQVANVFGAEAPSTIVIQGDDPEVVMANIAKLRKLFHTEDEKSHD